MKYMVTVTTLFIAGQKYKRGDVVDIADGTQYGTNLQPMPEPVEKPKPVRKPRAKKVVVDEDR